MACGASRHRLVPIPGSSEGQRGAGGWPGGEGACGCGALAGGQASMVSAVSEVRSPPSRHPSCLPPASQESWSLDTPLSAPRSPLPTCSVPPPTRGPPSSSPQARQKSGHPSEAGKAPGAVGGPVRGAACKGGPCRPGTSLCGTFPQSTKQAWPAQPQDRVPLLLRLLHDQRSGRAHTGAQSPGPA